MAARTNELERLHTILRDNILTGEVKRNGIGGIDPASFERSIEQVAEDFKFQKRPQASDIFDDQFLPPLNERLINWVNPRALMVRSASSRSLEP